MRLDFNSSNGFFCLFVDRSEPPGVSVLMDEYGFAFSQTASNSKEACLFTRQPYAAATFAHVASPAALEQMAWIVREVEASRASSSERHFDVPPDQELWDYQKADLEYMLHPSRDRVLDADEPGLGKTPTAIAYANEIQADRVLVIVPASIRFQWLRKIKEWSTRKNADFIAYAVVAGRGGVHPRANWTVVSYDLARTAGILQALRQTDYDLLILDEAHMLKTVESKRTRAVFGGGRDPLFWEALADRAKRVVALTGTPLPNRPREAYVISRHFDHAAVDWLSEERFSETYNPIRRREVMRRDGSIAVISDEKSGRHAELQNRMRAHFMCRHLKADVLAQLRYPEYDLVRAEETTAVKAALRAESLLGIDPDHLMGVSADILGHIAEARRQMGEAMAPQVARYIDMLIDGGTGKVACFYWHILVGDILEARLGRHGVVRVDGSTSAVGKDAAVQKFIDDPECRVIIGNTLSLGTGTDGLQQVCGHAVLAEPDWVPGNNQQAVDRLHRGGQVRTVQADLFVAPNSLSERILASSLRKLRVTHNALDRRAL